MRLTDAASKGGGQGNKIVREKGGEKGQGDIRMRIMFKGKRNLG